MSYVDEEIDLVVKKNPAEPEFHQAVKEVLESLRPVIEANEGIAYSIDEEGKTEDEAPAEESAPATEEVVAEEVEEIKE